MSVQLNNLSYKIDWGDAKLYKVLTNTDWVVYTIGNRILLTSSKR